MPGFDDVEPPTLEIPASCLDHSRQHGRRLGSDGILGDGGAGTGTGGGGGGGGGGPGGPTASSRAQVDGPNIPSCFFRSPGKTIRWNDFSASSVFFPKMQSSTRGAASMPGSPAAILLPWN